MEFNLKIGKTQRIEKTVTDVDTALKYGSGLLEVFATPAMIALMENTALNCVIDQLPNGYNTVGTTVNIKHIKATAIGQKVYCEAKLVQVDNKKLLFEISAFDEDGRIGFGTHERYIVHSDSFMEKLNKK
jgi:predicted thioesterase